MEWSKREVKRERGESWGREGGGFKVYGGRSRCRRERVGRRGNDKL
jgi:hypothetical protein